MKVNPSSHLVHRETCFGCSRLYPWALSYLMRATADKLNDYEERLLPYCDGFPTKPAWRPEPAPVRFLHRLFGYGVDVTDTRHPQHSAWLRVEAEYLKRLSEFKDAILNKRLALLERGRRAAKRIAFWKGLSGRQFEEQLAQLLIAFAFRVEHVGGKGDEGADLVIKTGRAKVVVQCKAYAKPVGPGPVRDLFGALMHHGAEEAWLVSLEGFSDAAISFAAGKPIKLIPISALLGAGGK